MKKPIALDMPPPTIGKHGRSEEPGDDNGSDTKRVAKSHVHSSHTVADQATSGIEAEQQVSSSAQDSFDENNGNTVRSII